MTGRDKQQTKRRRNTASASTSSSTTAPWPRDDGTPFTGPHITRWPANTTWAAVRDEFPVRRQGQPWGQREEIMYNSWLRVLIRPSRLMCAETLRSLGLLDEVHAMIQRMGLGTLFTRKYPLYPELVIQFYSSLQLHTGEDHRATMPSYAFITFMIRGVEYKVSISEICACYGFPEATDMSFPRRAYISEVWPLIGSGHAGSSRDCKISKVRNPVLRIVAKLLANLFFGKDEAGNLTEGELAMIYFGLPQFSTMGHYVNLGFQFALVQDLRKSRGLKIEKGKADTMGSLLTPIFRAAGIDLTDERRVDTVPLFDHAHMVKTLILKGDSQVYSYVDQEIQPRYVTLPTRPDLVSPTTPVGLEFRVPAELLVPEPARAHPLRRRQRSPPPPPAAEPPLSHSSGEEASEVPLYDPTEFAWQHAPVDAPDYQEQFQANMMRAQALSQRRYELELQRYKLELDTSRRVRRTESFVTKIFRWMRCRGADATRTRSQRAARRAEMPDTETPTDPAGDHTETAAEADITGADTGRADVHEDDDLMFDIDSYLAPPERDTDEIPDDLPLRTYMEQLRERSPIP